MSSADAPRRGTIEVALLRLQWSGQEVASPVAASLWVLVQIQDATGQPLLSLWFEANEENGKTKSIELTTGDGSAELEYSQRSRPSDLTEDTLSALVDAQLHLSLFRGASRSPASDECVGQQRVSMASTVLDGRMSERVSLANGITLDLEAQCDSELAEFALGARILRFEVPSVLHPPKEWLIACESEDEEALRASAESGELNPADYEVTVHWPSVDASKPSTGRFEHGRLEYTKAADASESAQAEDTPTSSQECRGTWSIRFPSAVSISRTYLKDAIPRLLDGLEVEKSIRCELHRRNVEHAERVTTVFALPTQQLLEPGSRQCGGTTQAQQVDPPPKATLEQAMAAASNDDKKKLQGILAAYDDVVGVAHTVDESMKQAGTLLEWNVRVLGAALVLDPPPTVAACKSMQDLITARDLVQEYDARKDVVKDFRMEIERVVLVLLREYEAEAEAELDNSSGANGAVGTAEARRKRLIFRLNTKGTYHDFKERLKTRVVAIIRQQFGVLTDDGAEADSSDHGDDQCAMDNMQDQDQPATSKVNRQKRQYFARLYALLMEHVHQVLHERLLAPLSRADALTDLQQREQQIAERLALLSLRAMEAQVNGDLGKAETLHLDRIAFAEKQAAAQEAIARAMAPRLHDVWHDYARFCLASQNADKAGGALRQCLSLQSRNIASLLLYGALLCELRDLASAEHVLKLAITECSHSAISSSEDASDPEDPAAHPAGSDDADLAPRHRLALAHVLLAMFYSQADGADVTGHLAMFEMLHAQRALQQSAELSTEGHQAVNRDRQATRRSSAWLLLAEFAHERYLTHVSALALEMHAKHRRPRDVLSVNERVLQRVLPAETLSRQGDGDRATPLLREALQVDATHPLAWLVLGQTELQLEAQTKSGIDCLQRAHAERDRLSASRRLALGVHFGLALLRAAQFQNAQRVFLCACDEFRTASNWLGVGVASLRIEDFDGARIALSEAVRLDGSNADVWGFLALLALTAPATTADQQHERECDARRCIAQALRLQLSNAALLRELSNALVAVDRLEDAERLLRRALVCQDSPMTRKTLADVLAAQNCAEDALRQYKQALLLQAPTQAQEQELDNRREMLAQCVRLLVTLGRSEEAAEYERMARAFDETRTNAGLQQGQAPDQGQTQDQLQDQAQDAAVERGET